MVDPAAPDDDNLEIWTSDATVGHWIATAQDRERRRGDLRRVMAELLPFADDEEFTFVDLGAGTGAAAKVVLERFPRSRAILADYSPQMMAEGSRVLAGLGERFRYVTFDLGSGLWPEAIPDEVAAVVSSLCVHHLPDQRKQELFEEIFDRLLPGGWFVNLDPVTSEDPLVEQAWQRANDRQDPEAASTRTHRSAEEQHRYDNHVRYMTPLAPQLELLRAAGFEAIDAYAKQLDYVVYAGRRPFGVDPTR